MKNYFFESGEPFISCDLMYPYADIVLSGDDFKLNQKKLDFIKKNISNVIYRPLNYRVFVEQNFNHYEHFEPYDFSFGVSSDRIVKNNIKGKVTLAELVKNGFVCQDFPEDYLSLGGYITGITKPSERTVLIIFIGSDFNRNTFTTNLELVKELDVPFILITSSNDDTCHPYFAFPCENANLKNTCDYLLEKNPFLLRWYTKNPSIIHPKIRGLPIGPKWQYKNSLVYGESKYSVNKQYNLCYNQPRNEFYKKNKQELVYFNFCVPNTDEAWYSPHKRIRRTILNCLVGKQFEIHGRCSNPEYIEQLKNHKFCISPPGKGLDCHRHWESLLVGTIPIMQSSPLDSLFDDLPVVLIEDWNTITKEFLEETYEQMIQKTYNFEKLYSTYWKKLIFSDAYSKIALNGVSGALNL